MGSRSVESRLEAKLSALESLKFNLDTKFDAMDGLKSQLNQESRRLDSLETKVETILELLLNKTEKWQECSLELTIQARFIRNYYCHYFYILVNRTQ